MGNAVYAAHGGARLVAIETQIKRFERSYRRRLRKFTRTSSRHGDLLFTFPAVPFALVAGCGTSEQRGRAMQLVRDGAPLAQIAGVLGLPAWLRRLPPEAFVRPFANLAMGDRFTRKIVGRLPGDTANAAAWLQAHEIAVEAAGEDFAYWLAAQPIYGSPFVGEPPVRPLAIYAWFSCQDDVRGRRLMQKAWTKQMRYQAAVEHMSVWYDRVLQDLTRADVKRGPGRYSQRRRGRGYEMVPLLTSGELREEGRLMANCVGSYAGMVAARECAIYSVRRGRHRVATLEVRWHGGRPRVWQLEGPANTAADRSVCEAVDRWLEDQNELFLATPAAIANLSIDATRWKAFWLPYATGKGTKTLTLDRPDSRTLLRLFADIEQLARRTGY